MHEPDTADCAALTSDLSREARRRMRETDRRPLFLADWVGAVFIHYEVDPAALQPYVPFDLELWNGAASVSAVAFTMRNFRTSVLPRIGRWLLRPISEHGFLNVRTYV